MRGAEDRCDRARRQVREGLIALTRAGAVSAVIVVLAIAAAAKIGEERGGPASQTATSDSTRADGGRHASDNRGLDPLWNSPGSRVLSGRVLARSTAGRPIRVMAFGSPRARRKLAVFGCIHGTECAGTRIAHRLLTGCPPRRVDLWVVPNLNPDGLALGTRLDGRGVDLNRNFPARWRPAGRRWDPQYPGPHPLSEPETLAARRLIRAVRPQTTIWFHQQTEPLVRAWGPSTAVARRYAQLSGLPFERLRWLPGTAPQWQNRRFSGSSSFVVELPLGRLGARDATRYAAAIERLARYRGENRLALEGPRGHSRTYASP
jgi:protein MpaA